MKSLLYLVLLLVAVLLIYLFFKGKSNSKNEDSQTSALPKVVFDDEPDMPVEFGYKSQWLVVKTENTEGIAKELHLADIQEANWSTESHSGKVKPGINSVPVTPRIPPNFVGNSGDSSKIKEQPHVGCFLC